MISIHAPRTGSDLKRARTRTFYRDISIHAPRTGSDHFAQSGWIFCQISIHAPRTGSDDEEKTHTLQAKAFQSTLPARGATFSLCRCNSNGRYFNPRSPHGERQKRNDLVARGLIFQSTLPARGATTGRRLMKLRAKSFQSTLPARGATVFCHLGGNRGSDFNPRSPHGERHMMICRRKSRRKFQSTLPARGATRVGTGAQSGNPISIHAPRTGSDERDMRMNRAAQVFQSTLPARGATCKSRSKRLSKRTNFNPRSPHGERRKYCKKTFSVVDFNPRSPHGERHAALLLKRSI